MSSDRDEQFEPMRFSSVTTVTYDAYGRAISVQDGTGRTFEYSAATAKSAAAAPAPERAPTARTAATPRVRRCFEFRLCGAEVREETLQVDAGGGTAEIVAIERLRAFLTRDGQPGSVACPISGIEVHAGLVGGRLACTAQLSDFAPGDLVVVQVDVALYALGGPP